MKYSMLTVAAFAATSLASPAYLWEESTKPGPISITNNLNQAVRLNPVSGKPADVDDFDVDAASIIIPYGHSITIQSPPPIADLKLGVLRAPGSQVEVAYVSRGQTFNYEIKRIERGGFPGIVHVRSAPGSQQCKPPSLTWFPRNNVIGPATCRAGTRLLVTLCQPGHPHCPPPPRTEDEFESL